MFSDKNALGKDWSAEDAGKLFSVCAEESLGGQAVRARTNKGTQEEGSLARPGQRCA